MAFPTSSTGFDANDDRPIAVPAAARATATSPSGCTACTPVGEMSTGRLTSWPITVVARSRVAGRSATCGRSRSSENAATLSFIVTPASAPATRARYTPFGSCRRARRWASATVSNHVLVLAISELRDAGVRRDLVCGNELRFIRGEEQDGVRDVLGLGRFHRQHVD